MLILLFIIPLSLRSQPISVRAGIYDFTDITAREFYVLAPTVVAGYDAWRKSQLSFCVSAGFSFNSIKYNDHRHYLYMIPVFLTMNYDLLNPDAKVWPVIGGGLSLIGKADQNKDFSKTIYSFTYGYHATGGVHIRLKKGLIITADLTYNLLLPPVMEELNVSGVIAAFGVKLPLIKKR
jgi:hypothetical protein